jgi:foldase protein PrsA
VAISKAAVDHWASVMSAGRAGGSGSDAKRYERVRQQALSQLISWQWLIAEAERRGFQLSAKEVRRRQEEKQQSSFPGGQGELQAYLKAIGETVSDLRLEALAEVASGRLRQAIAAEVPEVSSAQVAAYYRHHKQSFFVPERRELLITNRKTNAKAQQVIREVESGKISMTRFPRELRPLAPNLSTGARPVLERAIRAATPNVLSGPIKQLAVGNVFDYFVFEVRRVLPARYRTLADVRAALYRQLQAHAKRRALSAFIRAWRRRWIARTDCSRGYVVQKCRQYAGPSLAGDAFARQ